MPRYQVSDGLVLRRTPLPNGDVVLTILSDHGTWRAIARKGRLPGGNQARASLFHDVTVQVYRRRDDDLAILTQVRLNGALPGLTRPDVYPFAHVLADLTDALTVDVHVGERLLRVVTSALRGLVQHHDPEAVALTYVWHLLRLAGLAPRPGPCDVCGASANVLAVSAGALRCDVHGDHVRDVWLGPSGAAELDALLRRGLREAIDDPPTDRVPLWRATLAFAREHVGDVRALVALVASPPDRRPAGPGAVGPGAAGPVAPDGVASGVVEPAASEGDATR